MPFTARINIRFGDCDPAGLVYYPLLLFAFKLSRGTGRHAASRARRASRRENGNVLPRALTSRAASVRMQRFSLNATPSQAQPRLACRLHSSSALTASAREDAGPGRHTFVQEGGRVCDPPLPLSITKGKTKKMRRV